MFNLKSQPLLISVIIPTYKPKAYLWECLDSIANQTISSQNYEVIIVLNGCTEPWAGELEKYISSNMSGLNVNFVNCEEGGVSNARNIALNLAKGEYITFIDDDDYGIFALSDNIWYRVSLDGGLHEMKYFYKH